MKKNETSPPLVPITYKEDLSKHLIQAVDKDAQIININTPEPLTTVEIPTLDNDKVEEARTLLTMLNKSRAEDREEWLKVGFALHNIDQSLLKEWIIFSKTSNKYKKGECEKIWKDMKGGYTMGSLHYWAKMDNPKLYFKHFNENIYKNLLDLNLRWLGYCMTGETKEQLFLMCIGYSAQNGKVHNSKVIYEFITHI